MREIKFRAFSHATKTWWYMKIVNQDRIEYVCSYPRLELIPFEHLTDWMQYTGENTDSYNDEEIYVGDILKIKNPMSCPAKYLLWEVIEYKGNTCIKRSTVHSNLKVELLRIIAEGTKKRKMQIVGNIFENPELLEAKSARD